MGSPWMRNKKQKINTPQKKTTNGWNLKIPASEDDVPLEKADFLGEPMLLFLGVLCKPSTVPAPKLIVRKMTSAAD